MRPIRMRLLLALPLLLLAACGSSSGSSDALPATSRADNDLAVEYDAGDGSAVQSWTLTCAGSAEGSHPQAERACEHLKSLEQPFAPLPPDQICSQQFGGPQTAKVTGLWRGEPVDLTLSRVNGCFISQWDSLVPLVPPAS